MFSFYCSLLPPRLMFWTDWGMHPRIERASLDGTGRVAIVSYNVSYPNGLAIDYDLDRLYWCDGIGSIEYSTFDGRYLWGVCVCACVRACVCVCAWVGGCVYGIVLEVQDQIHVHVHT